MTYRMPKYEAKDRFPGYLGKYTHSGNKTWPVYGILHKKNFY